MLEKYILVAEPIITKEQRDYVPAHGKMPPYTVQEINITKRSYTEK